MSPHDVLAQRIRTERGLILLALRHSTGRLDERTIRATLDALGHPTERDHFQRHLLYLVDRGWLAQDECQAAGMALTLYRLTPDGRDVLAGIIEHPGVLIPDVHQAG